MIKVVGFEEVKLPAYMDGFGSQGKWFELHRFVEKMLEMKTDVWIRIDLDIEKVTGPLSDDEHREILRSAASCAQSRASHTVTGTWSRLKPTAYMLRTRVRKDDDGVWQLYFLRVKR